MTPKSKGESKPAADDEGESESIPGGKNYITPDGFERLMPHMVFLELAL